MKKYLAVLCVLSIAFASCNSDAGKADKADNAAAQKMEEVIKEKENEAVDPAGKNVDTADYEAQSAQEIMDKEKEIQQEQNAIAQEVSQDTADYEAQSAPEVMAEEQAIAQEEDAIAEEESEYATFEKNMTELYKNEGITDIIVAPYAKGIDIIFHVDNKNMTKDTFTAIAKEVVKQLKDNFDYLDKDLPIGCSLEYQPDPNQDTQVLMTEDVK
mgnify:CR=1 FL=1